MKTEYQLSTQESEQIKKLLSIFYQAGFKEQKLPEIYWSDEIPPQIQQKYPNKEITDLGLYGILDEMIEEKKNQEKKLATEVLGIYDYKPGENKEGIIILYKKTIEYCGKYLGKKWLTHLPDDAHIINDNYAITQLRLIVLLHEIGHWIAHWLPDENNNRWYNMKDCTDFHEAWAQLMVVWSLHGNPSALSDFGKLSEVQPEIYRGHNKLIDISNKFGIIETLIACRNEDWIDLASFSESVSTNNPIGPILYKKRGPRLADKIL